MLFIQYFTRSATDPKRLVEAVGDRAVIVLDARRRETVHHAIAMDEGERRGFPAYCLMRGDSFTRAVRVSGVFMPPAMLTEGCVAD